MAKRNEIKMDQIRELKHPSTGRYANINVAKCRVLKLDQPAELYHRGDGSYASSRYKEHQDLILVEVLEKSGWEFDRHSSLQTDRKPVKKIEGYARYGSQCWETEDLPKGQYLVKPKLLGPIWDEDEKREQARIKAIHAARKKAYDAAVRAQDQELSKELELAGVSSSKWRGDYTWRLSSNDLAKLINQILQNEAVPEVHWVDYENLNLTLDPG